MLAHGGVTCGLAHGGVTCGLAHGGVTCGLAPGGVTCGLWALGIRSAKKEVIQLFRRRVGWMVALYAN